MENNKMTGRLFRLWEIDRILSQNYSGENPDTMMSVKEIYQKLKERSKEYKWLQPEIKFTIHPKEEKTLRKDIELFKQMMEYERQFEGSCMPDYQLLESEKLDIETGRMVKCYAIPSGKSFFRNPLGHWQLELLESVLAGLKMFDLDKKLESLKPFLTTPGKKGLITPYSLPPVVDLSVNPLDEPVFFPILVNAISSGLETEIKYLKLEELPWKNNAQMRKEIVLPLQIKRFGNRWVLLGMVKSNGYIVNFSFDQISEVRLTGNTFPVASRQRIKNLFRNTVGPTLPYEKSKVNSSNEIYQPLNEDDNLREEDIIFFALPHRAVHIATFPIMPDGVQKEITDTSSVPAADSLLKTYPEGRLFKLEKVYITREMKEILFKRMDNIVVISPQWLRKDMKKRVTHLAKLYK